MKSTIRFDSNNSYTCKQMNVVSSTDPTTSIEAIDGNNVLVAQSNIDIDLDTVNSDTDFTLTLKDISVSSPIPLSCYVSYGYPRKISGNIFMVNATTTPQDLVITKIGNTSTVRFGGTLLDLKTNITGPIKELEIKHDITGVSSLSDIIDIRIGDIIYVS
jgi:hypothetical protein